jgi:hypothetical protein
MRLLLPNFLFALNVPTANRAIDFCGLALFPYKAKLSFCQRLIFTKV